MEAHRGDFWSRGPAETILFLILQLARVEIIPKDSFGDQQLKAILPSAQYDKPKVDRHQAKRWVTQARLGWQ